MCANQPNSTTPTTPATPTATPTERQCVYCGKKSTSFPKNSSWCSDCEQIVVGCVPTTVQGKKPEDAFDMLKAMFAQLMPNCTDEMQLLIDEEIAKAKTESNLGKSKPPPVIKMDDPDLFHENEK
jgi:hypothetical protein